MHKQDDSQLRLILASQSPRRIELLQGLGLSFEVFPSLIDEPVEFDDPWLVVESLAQRKAQAVADIMLQSTAGNMNERRTLILAADTVVAVGKEMLGKPASREEAYQMLVRMSGRAHKVYTGVALLDVASSKTVVAHQATTVFFRSLDSAEMRAYARTDEPFDKAGGYALQGCASAFVEKIEGCFSNVIGLPVPLTVKMLRSHAVSVLGLP